MVNPVSTYLRQASRRPNEPLRILTFPTHERYETGLCQTGHHFYAYRTDGVKNWNANYAPLPSNYQLLPHNTLPPHLTFDLVLSQNKFGQFPIAAKIAGQYGLPLVSLEHTLPFINWDQSQIEEMKNMRGHINIFISEYSQNQWGVENANVIHHMVDQDVFLPPSEEKRDSVLLSVVNDWINRDWCCNFSDWKWITQGTKPSLPVRVFGDTPGLSKPAKSVAELVKGYQTSKIFLNTSTISPVPTALLEAMACGCAVVSTATCMIPEVIEHGVNGLISNDKAELRGFCEQLLNDDGLCRHLGQNAVKTISEKFSKHEFINNWHAIFKKAANISYCGA